MPPIPCSKCGINFMRQDLNPETPNICNNCFKPEKKPIDEISILITCDVATQRAVEEICVCEGISFSEYFLALHKLNLIDSSRIIQARKAKNTDFHLDTKTDAKLPEGWGEVDITHEEPLITQELEDPPKKRGRPFKIVDK